MENRATILVVDDHEVIQLFTERILTDAGYRVLVANNGIEALGILATHPVNLILAEINMPRMNGYQLHDEVVNDPRWVAIPFVFVTGRIMDSDIRYGKELGVDDYITKPFDPDDLVAVVRGRLRRAKQLMASAYRPGVKNAINGSVLTIGALKINLDRHSVEFAGEPVNLSAREFTLLATLAKCEGSVVSPEELVRVTHELHTDCRDASSLVRPMIRSLRRKLGYPAGEMGCINNVRGVGYQLITYDG
ncbi:MAG: response regulator transcription factor [Anaerolineae bacterium]|nr:response regulator transcription factor [Anaerolineae bacterium]